MCHLRCSTTQMRRAAVTVSDFALVNSCYASASSLGLTFTTPLLFGLFRQLFVIASLRVRRAILFMPRSTIAISTYLSLNSLTPTRWQAGEPTPRVRSSRPDARRCPGLS